MGPSSFTELLTCCGKEQPLPEIRDEISTIYRGDNIGFFSGLCKVVAVGVGIAVLGPLAVTAAFGPMDGIDGYCDD
jgi:hypothetical protein